MNILKKFHYIILAMGFVVFTACEDDFTQDDLLELQQSQLDAAIASLNNSGQFAAAIIQVVTYDGTPVSGATVTLANAVDSSGAQSVTTGADGVASFSSVIAGGNWISISSADHIDMIATADIGSIEYEVINGSVIPIKSSGSAVIPVFPTSGSETATISGKVTIQTNVTTAETEVADSVEVTASVNLYTDDREGVSGNFNLQTLQFSNDAAIGSDFTDANGEYSVTVPAPQGGITYKLLFPTITRDQVIGISARDGAELGTVVIDTVATSFGSLAGGEGFNGTITQYPGINIEASDPPAQGRGLGLTFTRLGRDWGPGTVTFNDASSTGVSADGAMFKATSRGSGYIASPQVTISDASGTGVYATASAEYAITGLTIETGDVVTGYTADSDVTFRARYRTGSWNPTTTAANATDTTVGYTNVASFDLTVRTNAAGTITQDSVNAALAAAVADSDTNPADQGYDPNNLEQIDAWVVDLELFDSQAGGLNQLSLNVTSAVGRVYELDFVFAPGASVDNDNYINPSVAFAGGGASAQTVFTIESFEAPYSVVPDNSALTSGYPILPEDIRYEYFSVSANVATGEPVSGESFQRMDIDRTAIGTATFDHTLVFQADSTVSLKSGLTSVETSRSVSTPIARIDERREECAFWAPTSGGGVNITVEKNGQISAIGGTGVSTYTSVLGNDVRYTLGSGYTSAPTITVSSPFGSGAVVAANGNYNSAGEYELLAGFEILSGGTGYQRFINLVTFVDDDGIPTFELKAGDEVTYNYNYGTGYRSEDVR